MKHKNLTIGIEVFHAQHYQKAFNLLNPIADEGDAEAQCILGNLYQLGLGVEINVVEAVKWYARSAHQGYAIASNNLAGIYLAGDSGVERNYSEALRWCRLSQAQGFESSKYLEAYILSQML